MFFYSSSTPIFANLACLYENVMNALQMKEGKYFAKKQITERAAELFLKLKMIRMTYNAISNFFLWKNFLLCILKWNFVPLLQNDSTLHFYFVLWNKIPKTKTYLSIYLQRRVFWNKNRVQNIQNHVKKYRCNQRYIFLPFIFDYNLIVTSKIIPTLQ